MNITIFKQEEGQRFLLTLTRDNDKEIHSLAFDLSQEELRQLRDEITRELDDLEKDEFQEEIVWNPRSQRHERVRK